MGCLALVEPTVAGKTRGERSVGIGVQPRCNPISFFLLKPSQFGSIMALIGLEQLSRPGKFTELLTVLGLSIAFNLGFLVFLSLIFGLLAGSVLQALKSGVAAGFIVASTASLLVSLRHGIIAELKPNASLGS